MTNIYVWEIVHLIFTVCLFVTVTATSHDECFKDTFSVVNNVCVRWISCNPEKYESTADSPHYNMMTENGTCKSLCGKGSYPVGHDCDTYCPYGFKVFNDTICVKTCPKGYFFPSEFKWPPRCEKCKKCEQCDLLYFKDQCVDLCPDGYIGLRSVCVDRCPFFIQENVCVENCYSAYFPGRDSSGQGICTKCHPECATCYGHKDTECNQCKHKSEGGRCVPYCPRDKPMYFNTECFKSCPSVVINGTCVENCPDIQVKFNHSCVDQCPENITFLFQNECLDECPLLYLKLSDKNVCVKSCPNEYPFEQNGTCLKKCPGFKVNGECVQQCPPGYLIDTEGKSCVSRCPEPRPYILNTTCVEKCDKFLFGIACYEQCPHNYPSLGGTCTKTCPALYHFHDPDTKECLMNCPYKIFNGKCLKECPTPLTSKPDTSSCEKPCPPLLYFSNGKCIKDCPAKIQTSSGQCVAECPHGTYERGNLCQDCHPFCSPDHRCSGPGSSQCEQCDLFLFNKECLSACPDSHPYEAENKHCVSTCPNGTFSSPVTKRCYSKCPEEFQYISTVQLVGDTYSYSDDKKHCTQSCSPAMAEVLDPFKPETKICMEECTIWGGVYVPGGSCVKQCSQNLPLEGKKYGLRYCNNVCPFGSFILDASSCVQICPDSHHVYIKNDAQRYCLPGERGHCVDKCSGRPCLSGIFDRCSCSCMLSCPTYTYHMHTSNDRLIICELMAPSVLRIFSPLLVTILLVFVTYLVCKFFIGKKIPPILVSNPSMVKGFLLRDNDDVTETHPIEDNSIV